MTKLTLLVELDYDGKLWGIENDPDAEKFLNSLLRGENLHLGERGELDDDIGAVKVLDIQQPAAPETGERPCACHPDDNPPVPCAKKYACSECIAKIAHEWRAEEVAYCPKCDTRYFKPKLNHCAMCMPGEIVFLIYRDAAQ